ncbi:MAG TPA: type II toxin-antitoxin system RelE/ParE family toxin [Alloacidobacterium sp.]|jgi:phage-related protein|nr:type II toxin-antitoxin system RelE/ParE family toxin [Alloacidobacterium sp.]
METKPILFIGSSRDDLREFPAEVRKALGDELLRVQSGLMPVDFKPLKDVGKGAYEIRVHLNGAWRVIYVAKFANAIYVLHAFEKKTRKTSQNDLELAKRRYKLIGE